MTPSSRWFVVAGAVCAVVLAVAARAAEAASPSASTGPATAIGATTATVTGTVGPGGQSTTWYVEYGTSTSYGSKTSSASAGSGSVPVGVTADLTGLQPGATYHYRIVATNGAGTSHGGDGVFTTLVPPGVVTGAATGVGATTATLGGTVDANGRATTFYFEYGTSTSYGTKTSVKSAGSGTSAQPVSAAVSALQPGRTYHFRLVATSDAGTTTGGDATFSTSAAPAVVTGGATSIGPSSATLHGTVTPNGLATTWWFEYGTTTGYGSKTGKRSAGSGTSATSVSVSIGGLKTATTYHFRLVAQNSSGTSVGDDQALSTAAPPTVQTATAAAVGADTAQLSGVLDSKGRSTTWWFEYGTSTGYGKATPQRSGGSQPGAQTVSATLTGLSPATTYHYRLVARNDAGTTQGSDVAFTTTGVTATAAKQVVYGGRVRLGGLVPTRQAGEQVLVYAQPYGEGSFRQVATVVTGAGGEWTYLARPRIGTAYAAGWRGGLSPSVSVSVHPRVTLALLRNGRVAVGVVAGRSFAGRIVQIQRRVGARWVTVQRVRLGPRSRAESKLVLPKGRSTLRAAFSVNQAGAGFLGGTSRALRVTG